MLAPKSFDRTGQFYVAFFPLGLMGCVFTIALDKKRRRLWALCLIVVAAAISAAACGPPPPQKYGHSKSNIWDNSALEYDFGDGAMSAKGARCAGWLLSLLRP